MIKNTKKTALLSLGVIFLAGCLVSGTFIITLDIEEFWSKSTTQEFEAHAVDLTTEQVWIDHKDDIKNISDIRFRAVVEEELGNDATGVVYFSENGTYTSPDDVRSAADAFVVFSGLKIPANGALLVTFAESANYRQNLDLALELIETGKFYIYVLTPTGAFELYVHDIYILITFDAGQS